MTITNYPSNEPQPVEVSPTTFVWGGGGYAPYTLGWYISQGQQMPLERYADRGAPVPEPTVSVSMPAPKPALNSNSAENAASQVNTQLGAQYVNTQGGNIGFANENVRKAYSPLVEQALKNQNARYRQTPTGFSVDAENTVVRSGLTVSPQGAPMSSAMEFPGFSPSTQTVLLSEQGAPVSVNPNEWVTKDNMFYKKSELTEYNKAQAKYESDMATYDVKRGVYIANLASVAGSVGYIKPDITRMTEGAYEGVYTANLAVITNKPQPQFGLGLSQKASDVATSYSPKGERPFGKGLIEMGLQTFTFPVDVGAEFVKQGVQGFPKRGFQNLGLGELEGKPNVQGAGFIPIFVAPVVETGKQALGGNPEAIGKVAGMAAGAVVIGKVMGTPTARAATEEIRFGASSTFETGKVLYTRATSGEIRTLMEPVDVFQYTKIERPLIGGSYAVTSQRIVDLPSIPKGETSWFKPSEIRIAPETPTVTQYKFGQVVQGPKSVWTSSFLEAQELGKITPKASELTMQGVKNVPLIQEQTQRTIMNWDYAGKSKTVDIGKPLIKENVPIASTKQGLQVKFTELDENSIAMGRGTTKIYHPPESTALTYNEIGVAPVTRAIKVGEPQAGLTRGAIVFTDETVFPSSKRVPYNPQSISEVKLAVSSTTRTEALRTLDLNIARSRAGKASFGMGTRQIQAYDVGEATATRPATYIEPKNVQLFKEYNPVQVRAVQPFSISTQKTNQVQLSRVGTVANYGPKTVQLSQSREVQILRNSAPQAQTSKVSDVQISRIAQPDIQIFKPVQIMRPAQNQIQLERAVQITRIVPKQPTPTIPRAPPPVFGRAKPPPKPPTFPPLVPSFPSLGGIFGKRTRKSKYSRKTKYSPSLVATMFKIKGSKQQGIGAALSGIAVRPIIANPFKRRKKR